MAVVHIKFMICSQFSNILEPVSSVVLELHVHEVLLTSMIKVH